MYEIKHAYPYLAEECFGGLVSCEIMHGHHGDKDIDANFHATIGTPSSCDPQSYMNHTKSQIPTSFRREKSQTFSHSIYIVLFPSHKLQRTCTSFHQLTIPPPPQAHHQPKATMGISHSDCMKRERIGQLYWKNGACHDFTKEVCESVEGKWVGYRNPCRGAKRYVESGKPMDHGMGMGEGEKWSEELDKVVKRACAGGGEEECGETVVVDMQ